MNYFIFQQPLYSDILKELILYHLHPGIPDELPNESIELDDQVMLSDSSSSVKGTQDEIEITKQREEAKAFMTAVHCSLAESGTVRDVGSVISDLNILKVVYNHRLFLNFP